MAKIYPSLMAANLLDLANEIKKLEPYSDGFHIDVMDNHFVPNITFGIDTINAVAKATSKQLWVHLMVENPEKFISLINLPPNSIFSFHWEAKNDPSFITEIKEKGWLPSIALRPATNPETIFPVLKDIYQVLIMTVEPGFGGQRFLDSVVDKIDPLTNYRKAQNSDFKIGMDGGIDAENIAMLAQRGVDDFSIGSAIFNQSDPVLALQDLRQLVS